MPAPQPKRDPIPAFARDVLALYTQALADVRFPDLDLARLSAERDAACAAQLALERVEDELAAARAHLQQQLDALAVSSERALAYARIFASDDAPLLERIAGIGRAPTPAARGLSEPEPKKRRARRKDEPDAQLFAGAEAPQPAAATEHAA